MRAQGPEQPAQFGPDVIEHPGLRCLVRVDAVGLEQRERRGRVCHAGREEGHQGRLFRLRYLGIEAPELLGMLAAVVGRHLHAQQQHAMRRTRAPDVPWRPGCRASCPAAGRAAQSLPPSSITTSAGAVLLEQARQAGAPARRGVAADARVDDLPAWLLPVEPLLQQRGPAAAALQAVFGAQRSPTISSRLGSAASTGRAAAHDPPAMPGPGTS